eukprot:6032822-Pyramimonas_sp.AAC.1
MAGTSGGGGEGEAAPAAEKRDNVVELLRMLYAPGPYSDATVNLMTAWEMSFEKHQPDTLVCAPPLYATRFI